MQSENPLSENDLASELEKLATMIRKSCKKRGREESLSSDAARTVAKPPSGRRLLTALEQASEQVRRVPVLERQIHDEKRRSSTEKRVLWEELRAEVMEREAHAAVVVRRHSHSARKGDAMNTTLQRTDTQFRRLREHDCKALGNSLPSASEQAARVARSRTARVSTKPQ